MKLEFPEKKHEKEHMNMLQDFLDNKEEIIPFSANLQEWETYDGFLERTKNRREGRNLEPGEVRSILYSLIDDDEKVVWVITIRPELNDGLRFNAGNIGYSVKYSERRKGYATTWLALALQKCKELWLEKVLLTCRKDNIGSLKTIIKNWWIRDSEYENEGHTKERYWIPIT